MFGFKRQKAATWEDVYRIKAEIEAEMAAEDARFDEYRRGNPKYIACQMTNISGGTPYIGQQIDYDDYKQWKSARMKETHDGRNT